MDQSEMRDFSEFCAQLNEMRARFHSWDNCEKTVALYYLMVGLPFANARFLQNTLERCIAAVITPEAQVLERNANDPTFVSRLMSEKPQTAATNLLAHLPLLKPGNKEATTSYLTTIRRVLSEHMTPFKIYNECVEIMSYVFVHPAFDKEDKKTFKQLLKQVNKEDKFIDKQLKIKLIESFGMPFHKNKPIIGFAIVASHQTAMRMSVTTIN